MKNYTIIFFSGCLILSLLFLPSCAYWEKKEEWQEAQKGTSYYHQSLKEAKRSQKTRKKEDFEKEIGRKISSLKDLEKNKRMEWNKDHLESPLYDFSTPENLAIQKKIQAGLGEKELRKEVTPSLLLNYGFLKNPALQEAKRKLFAVIAQYSQASFLEELVYAYQSFVRDLNLRVGSMKHKNPISRRYPYPATLSLKGEILEKNFQIAWENYRKAERDFVVALLKDYYQILYLEKAIKILRTHESLLKGIHQVSLKLYEGGKFPESNVLRVQVELSKINDDLITLEQKRLTALASLNKNLSRPKDSPFGPFVSEDLPLPKKTLKELVALALKSRQELRIEQAKWEKMDLMVKLLRERFHPDFVQSLGILDPSSFDFYGTRKNKKALASVKRTSPRYWFGAQESFLREVEEEREKAKQAFQKRKDSTRFLAKKIYYLFDQAKREMALYVNSLIPRAKQSYQVIEKDYEGGRASFNTLIDAERLLLNYQLRYEATWRDRNFRILEIWQVVGKRI